VLERNAITMKYLTTACHTEFSTACQLESQQFLCRDETSTPGGISPALIV
jgi:hypothetical protein